MELLKFYQTMIGEARSPQKMYYGNIVMYLYYSNFLVYICKQKKYLPMNTYRFSYQLIIAFLIFACIGCSNQKKDEFDSKIVNIPVSADGKNEKARMPKFEFEQTQHDFGKLIQGEKVSFTYKFKNVGDAMLVISSVLPGCNCTVAQFTQTPVPPGETGSITINFNTETKKGLVNSTVVVQANTYPADTRLSFTANVDLP